MANLLQPGPANQTSWDQRFFVWPRVASEQKVDCTNALHTAFICRFVSPVGLGSGGGAGIATAEVAASARETPGSRTVDGASCRVSPNSKYAGGSLPGSKGGNGLYLELTVSRNDRSKNARFLFFCFQFDNILLMRHVFLQHFYPPIFFARILSCFF